MSEIRVEAMTSAEIAAAVAEGARTAVLPLGAIEQHGPHLPLSMDSDHADALAMRVASELGDALVLPTVRVGHSPHHLGFAGTLSLRESTLEAVCVDYCEHLAPQGFERVVIFSAHIGNYPVMRGFEERLRAALAPLTVVMFTDHRAILDVWRDAADRVAGLGERVRGHADVAETSVMLALHPRTVRMRELAPGYLGAVDERVLQRAFEHGVHTISPSGTLGDPVGASAEIGEACLEDVASLIADFARSPIARP